MIASKVMKISVVIPTHNRRDSLGRMLPFVLCQYIPAEDYEVIVVVDGSTDGTAQLLQGLKPACSFRVIEQPNRGLAAARNAGWKVARSPLVLFLDDDIHCDAGLLQAHLRAHQDAPPAVVLGPVFTRIEGPGTLAGDWAKNLDWSQDIGPDLKLHWPRHAVVDANTSLPRSALELCAGYNEAFRNRENVDLALRLGKMGLSFRYAPEAIAYHLYNKSAGAIIQRDAALCGREEIILCRQHPDFRPYSALARLQEGNLVKRLIREAATRLAVSPEPWLRPAFWLAERLRSIPAAQRAGTGLLQARRGIVIFRNAVHQAGSWPVFRSEFGMRLPVLLYHNVGPRRHPEHQELTLSAGKFERQMRWLAAHRYTSITASDWLAWCREARPLPSKPVLITFDDGYADIGRYALPVLRRHGFRALVFVVTGQVGGTNSWDQAPMMTGEQIRGWADQGIEFGAHSRTHPDLRALSATELDYEIKASREDLREILGADVAAFAYPYGFHNQDVQRCASEAFQCAFSTEEGLNDLSTNPHLLRRTMVQPDDILPFLACRLRLGYSPAHRLRALIQVRARAKALWQRVRGWRVTSAS